MYDNRDLNIAKSKKLEQYIREIFEIFTNLFLTDAKRDVILEGGLITDFLGDTSSLLDTSLLCFLIEIVLEKEKLAYQQHN